MPRTRLLLAALTLATGTASAQRADTTAASEADDAFGLSVAGETIGLYSDKYVRGFSPVNAGNLRLDGLYIDRQGEFTDRLFADVAVRVGATALETPLPAPSGIADYSLRRPGAGRIAEHRRRRGIFWLAVHRPRLDRRWRARASRSRPA